MAAGPQKRSPTTNARNHAPSWRYERAASNTGALRIAGVDEAGRGPLAGPVVAAAVILKRSKPIPTLRDSKVLTQSEREELYHLVFEKASALAVGVVPPETIDEINIYQATRQAMMIAVQGIVPLPDHLLIDGNIYLDIQLAQTSIIKGDSLSYSVAAAGILAKVTRDRLMNELHEQYPQYGFASHKGYATQAHRDAICRYGPCPVHRKCFRGVREYLPTPLFDR